MVLMMLIPCRLEPSPIHGTGLFATAPVAAGAGARPVGVLPAVGPVQQAFVSRYAYFDNELQALVLCADDARFMNHSDQPNVGPVVDGACVALQPIAADAELTCDYRALDSRAMLFQPNAVPVGRDCGRASS
jgi:uncharacterized protein